MKFAFMKTHRHSFALERMSKVLGISKAGYFKYLAHVPSKRQQENSRLTEAIKLAHKKCRRTYGYRRMKAELESTSNINISKNRTLKLMKLHGIIPKTRRRFRITTQSNHCYERAVNRLQRQFSAKRPNEKWVSDITYIPTKEGFLYCAVILDLFSRKVVGLKTGDNMGSDLVADAFRQAVYRRKYPKDFLFHSDQGAQYASDHFRRTLSPHGVLQSMSRKGNCWDNAVSESFFRTLKTELMIGLEFKTRHEAQRSIFEYVEVFYNNERRHSTLGYLPPNEFEKRYKLGRLTVN